MYRSRRNHHASQAIVFVAGAFLAFALWLSKLEEISRGGTPYWIGAGYLVFGIVVAVVARRCRVPTVEQLFLVWLLAFGVLAVSSATDAVVAVGNNGLLTLLAIGMVLLSRTADSDYIYALLWGIFGGLLTFLAVGVVAFSSGQELTAHTSAQGRFSPYGMNPERAGSLFALTGALALVLLYWNRATTCVDTNVEGGVGAKSRLCSRRVNNRVGRRLMRVITVVVVCLSAAFVVLSGSRSALILLFPVVLVAAGVQGGWKLMTLASSVLAGMWIGMQGTDLLSEWTLRDASLDVSGRDVIMSQYVGEIGERPWFGLLFVSDLPALRGGREMVHAHNSYVGWWYMGGVVLAVPLFLILMGGLWRAGRAWATHGSSPEGGVMALLTALLVGCYLHAAVTVSMIDSTSLVAVVVFAVLAYVLGRCNRLRSLAQRRRAEF